MANFFDEMQNELNHDARNQILTTNGAVAYASVGDSLVDFSYAASSLRNKTPEQIMAMFERCYKDNPLLATKLMFQMGDVREGKGERRTFNTCLRYMAQAHPDICKALLPLVPEYTRWDHVAEMTICGVPMVERFARRMIAEQLQKDYEIAQQIEKDGKKRPLSLCAKWAPALGAKKNNMGTAKGAPKRNKAKAGEHHKIALKLVQTMGISNAQYRKMRSAILRHLNVIERDLSAGRLEDTNLEHMTSAQQAKYRNVMREKNADKYEEYLDKVEAGEAKMNAQVKTPADIVHAYSLVTNNWHISSRPYDRTLELMWKNLKQVDVTDGNSCIVVRDDSGSMINATVSKETSMTAYEVATGLALYCAERLPGAFKDRFITFSGTPRLMDTSPFTSLYDKLDYCYAHSEVANTDVKAVFDLLLKTAVRNNMSQAEIPGSILIISDMEFDAGTSQWRSTSYSGAPQKALFEEIRDEWKTAGYEMPVLAFWNLNTQRAVVPTMDDRGVVLMSGFNVDNLELAMSGQLAEFTPAKQLEWALSKPRYDSVEAAFEMGLKNERKYGAPAVSFEEYLPEEGYTKVSAPVADDFEFEDEYDEW